MCYSDNKIATDIANEWTLCPGEQTLIHVPSVSCFMRHVGAAQYDSVNYSPKHKENSHFILFCKEERSEEMIERLFPIIAMAYFTIFLNTGEFVIAVQSTKQEYCLYFTHIYSHPPFNFAVLYNNYTELYILEEYRNKEKWTKITYGIRVVLWDQPFKGLKKFLGPLHYNITTDGMGILSLCTTTSSCGNNFGTGAQGTIYILQYNQCPLEQHFPRATKLHFLNAKKVMTQTHRSGSAFIDYNDHKMILYITKCTLDIEKFVLPNGVNFRVHACVQHIN